MSTTLSVVPDQAYTRVEAAEVLRTSPERLRVWAAQGRGPRYSRTGAKRGRCLYMGADLADWLNAHKVDPATKGK